MTKKRVYTSAEKAVIAAGNALETARALLAWNESRIPEYEAKLEVIVTRVATAADTVAVLEGVLQEKQDELDRESSVPATAAESEVPDPAAVRDARKNATRLRKTQVG